MESVNHLEGVSIEVPSRYDSITDTMYHPMLDVPLRGVFKCHQQGDSPSSQAEQSGFAIQWSDVLDASNLVQFLLTSRLSLMFLCLRLEGIIKMNLWTSSSNKAILQEN